VPPLFACASRRPPKQSVLGFFLLMDQRAAYGFVPTVRQTEDRLLSESGTAIKAQNTGLSDGSDT
jgi:hypothetical protein